MSETQIIIKVNKVNREGIFNTAYNGSYYTIIGCGGELSEWIEGYTQMLEEEGIGKPSRFITFKGADMNVHYGLTDSNAYSEDLTCLSSLRSMTLNSIHYSLTSKKPTPTMAEKKIYFNKPQRLTQLIGANTTVIVAGRRTGKTDSIAAPFVLRNMQRMPGSTGGIVVPTFKHGLTNTIPGLLAAWRRWGYIEGLHYVVGRKPPKSFRQPIIDPKDYEHVISFYNGSVAIIISQDRPGSSNSLTLSWLLVDEAKFIDYAKLKDETLPANGGIKSHFGKHSFNHSIMILSDMPQSQKGSWFLHYRDKVDADLIKTIEATVYEIWRTKERIRALSRSQSPVPGYLKGYLRRLDRQLNQMRSVAVYYREYSSIENLQLLGENYIKQMKRDLTPLTFQTSILCQRIGIAKDGFYSSMREGHKYDANDNQYLDTLGYDYDFSTLDARADKDVDPDAPICIGMDYNANINWIVAYDTH